MYCSSCGLYVETDFSIVTDEDEAMRYNTYASEIEGDYSANEVGEHRITRDPVTEWEVRMRVDHCRNCGEVLRAMTFAVRVKD